MMKTTTRQPANEQTHSGAGQMNRTRNHGEDMKGRMQSALRKLGLLLLMVGGVGSAWGSTTTLTVTPNPSVAGKQITLTATVTGTSPTGSVDFMNGTTLLKTVALTSGKAIYKRTFTAVGTRSLTAVYGGDANDTGSTSAVVTHTVNKAPTTTTLSTTPNPAVTGQLIVMTATVTGASPTGTVDFVNGAASVMGTATLTNGQATFTRLFNGQGNRNLKAVYSGNANNLTSTSVKVVQVVNPTPTTTVLTTTPNPAAAGENIVLTATVTGAAPTGSVDFKNGATVLGTVTLTNGQATFNQIFTGVGNKNLSVVYSGDTNNLTSTSATVAQTVGQAPTVTTLSSSPNPSTAGQPVTLTASVTGLNPTGAVTFKDGATELGTATLSAGTATLSVPFNTAGTRTLTAVYAGDANDAISTSAAITVTINPATTTVTLTATPTLPLLGQSVTLTASVTNASFMTPTGTVTFMEGTTTLGTGNLATGTATLSHSFNTLGVHNLTAVYGGDSSNAASTSEVNNLLVNQAPGVALTSPAYGEQITAPGSITVSADAFDLDGTITKVEFYFHEGTTETLLATDTTAPYAYTWTNVPVGIYGLFAVATDNLGASSNTGQAQVSVVANVPPTVNIVTPANGTSTGAPASLAIVADAMSTTSNIAKVDFYANDGTTNTLIGTATDVPYTYTWNNVPIGNYTLTAIAADTHNASTTSASVSVIVNLAEARAYYIHTDHLDTPRQITDTAGNIVWQWDNVDPFGNNMPNENPSGQGAFENPLRFPGQYADKETNTYYNVNRDYEPATGRYIESDPIGLAGGSLSTYTYVDGNPLSYTDPLGLDFILVRGGSSGTATYYNGAGTPVMTIPMKSGYGPNKNDSTKNGQGKTPPGPYQIEQKTRDKTGNSSFCDSKGHCWSVPTKPKFKVPKDRCPASDPCSVHPDGGCDGTAGCTGLDCNADTNKFRELIDNYNPSPEHPLPVAVLPY